MIPVSITSKIKELINLSRQSNDSAAKTSAGVAGSLAQFVSADAEIVDISVNDDGAADDVVDSAQRDLFVGNVDLGDAASVGLNVSQVANVTNGRVWSSVFQLGWVEVRPSRGASVGVVAELMDVEAVRSWRQSAHFSSDGNWTVSLLRTIQR